MSVGHSRTCERQGNGDVGILCWSAGVAGRGVHLEVAFLSSNGWAGAEIEA